MRLVSDTTFETREEAIDSLQSLLPSDGSMEGHDLFVVDLDTVTPVLLMRGTEAAPSGDARGGRKGVGDEISAVAMASVPEDLPPDLLSPVEEEAGQDLGAGLADALRRAATQMEDEGITPAPQVEELAAIAAELSEEGDEGSILDDVMEPVEVEEPEPVAGEQAAHEVDASEEPAPDAEPSEPMSVVEESEPEAVPESEAATADTELATETEPANEETEPVATAEEAVEASEEAPAVEAPEGEAAADTEPESWPWGDAEVPGGESAAEGQPEATPEGGAGEHFTPDGLEEPAADAFSLLASAESDPGGPIIMGDYGDAAASAMSSSAAEAEGVEGGAEPVEEYSCNDCVYVASCPQAHKSVPSKCGSFQWKS